MTPFAVIAGNWNMNAVSVAVTAQGGAAPGTKHPVAAGCAPPSPFTWLFCSDRSAQLPPTEYVPHPPETYSSPLVLTAPDTFVLPDPLAKLKGSEGPVSVDGSPGRAHTTRPFRDACVVFKDVDQHALKVSQETQSNVRELLWQLIHAREIKNELDKVRVLFVWLCSKNPETIKFDETLVQKAGSPEQILSDLKTGQTTMATAFDLLCRHAGVMSKVIIGYAKSGAGGGAKEGGGGGAGGGERSKHVWNAVRVSEQWGLIDPMWAAAKVNKKLQPVTVESLHRDLDDFYFFSPPHDFLLTHIPDPESGPAAPAWQLLDPSIYPALHLDEFDRLVFLKSAFFRLGLQGLNHRGAVIQCQVGGGDGGIITIGCPQEKADCIAFISKLTTVGGSETDETSGVNLNRYVMQETIGPMTSYKLRLPSPGLYTFTVFAKETQPSPAATCPAQGCVEGAQPAPAPAPASASTFTGVCIYCLECVAPAPDPAGLPPAPVRPYPPCAYSRYGPSEKTSKYGLTPLQQGFIVHTVNGKAEIQIRLSRELTFMAKLKSNDYKEDKDLARYAMSRVISGVAIFNITAPPGESDELALEVYCRDPLTDGPGLSQVYQYLIIRDKPASGGETTPSPLPPPPVIPSSYLGPQPTFKGLGLRAASHPDPFIRATVGSFGVAFAVDPDLPPLRMSSQLIHVKHGDELEDSSEYVLQQSKYPEELKKLELEAKLALEKQEKDKLDPDREKLHDIKQEQDKNNQKKGKPRKGKGGNKEQEKQEKLEHEKQELEKQEQEAAAAMNHVENHVCTDRGVQFRVRLAKPGWYKLQIFASRASEVAESLPGVFNYLIECSSPAAGGPAGGPGAKGPEVAEPPNPCATCIPFPKQFSPWKEVDGACYLHEPLDGRLVVSGCPSSAEGGPTPPAIHFKVEAKKPNAVAVVIGKEWTPLALTPSGAWEGDVKMDKYWAAVCEAAKAAGGPEGQPEGAARETMEKVKVCAKLAEENYSVLLEYCLSCAAAPK